MGACIIVPHGGPASSPMFSPAQASINKPYIGTIMGVDACIIVPSGTCIIVPTGKSAGIEEGPRETTRVSPKSLVEPGGL